MSGNEVRPETWVATGSEALSPIVPATVKVCPAVKRNGVTDTERNLPSSVVVAPAFTLDVFPRSLQAVVK